MKQSFTKYHGTGNDFILIDDRYENFPVDDDQFIRKCCDRHFGIGADGMILLRQLSDSGILKMLYFNADGYPGSMCGNGGRCFARFAHDQGLFTETLQFDAFDGPHQARLSEDGNITLTMRDCAFPEKVENGMCINTGSPHFVQFVPDLSLIDIFQEGKKIRNLERYKENGINVNFVEVKESGLEMRTYERGVENITLSCGTGVTAAALCFAQMRQSQTDKITIDTPGGRLHVGLEMHDSGFNNILLIGPAEKVFSGTIEL